MIEATSRRVRAQIRHVLLNVWDPIGIKEERNAQDEYDSYLGEILGLLLRGATDEELSDRLLYVVNDLMGLEAKSEDMVPTVRALRSIDFPKP